MRIGIDIRPTLKQRTGIGQYTFNLINHLAKVDSLNKYLLYSKKKIIDRKRKLPKLPGQNFSHRVDYFSWGARRLLKGVEVFHTSSFDLEPPAGSKFILTVHDVMNKAYPEGHSAETNKQVDKQLRQVLPRAVRIIAVSECTRKDLLRWYEIDEHIVKVIYSGVNPWLSPRKTPKQDFILFVGTIEPRKNINNLIKAFDLLKREEAVKHKLVIVGMKGWLFEGIFELVNELGLNNEVIFKGFVDDEELANLYSQAQVFVYPSFYEGFGFPIVEAFACGVPVVTSNVSSCAEIAGDSALQVDPNSPRQMKEAILKLLGDSPLRESLINKGLLKAKSFSWEKTAREVLSVYNEAINAG